MTRVGSQRHSKQKNLRDVVGKCTCMSMVNIWFYVGTVMRRLTTGIRSEKRVVRRFSRCANIIECNSCK